MAKIRRGGFVFISWIGDHDPRHVHIYGKGGKFVAKWDLDRWRLMHGRTPRQLLRLLQELRKEGRL